MGLPLTTMSNLDVSRPWPRDTAKVPIHDAAAFAGMRRAGRLAAEALDVLVEHVRPGVTTDTLDRIMFDFALANDAIPATLNYRGYPK